MKLQYWYFCSCNVRCFLSFLCHPQVLVASHMALEGAGWISVVCSANLATWAGVGDAPTIWWLGEGIIVVQQIEVKPHITFHDICISSRCWHQHIFQADGLQGEVGNICAHLRTSVKGGHWALRAQAAEPEPEKRIFGVRLLCWTGKGNIIILTSDRTLSLARLYWL